MEALYPLYRTMSITSHENLLYGLLIGIAFGFIFERAGFGRSIHIASVFYLRNLRVPKMMITAILTASSLLIISIYSGLLDYDQLFIPNTYLWAYVVGGVLFGVGMVMSGWCPGTAIVGFATGKLDAAVFLLGLMVGMYFYFDYYDLIKEFANSTNVGRYTIQEALGVSVYTAYLITVALAIGLMLFMRKLKSIRDKKGEDI